jgi:hypothetical protein
MVFLRGQSPFRVKPFQGEALLELSRIDTYLLSGPIQPLESDNPVYFGEQREILPQPYVDAGMDFCAHLPNEDAPGSNLLPAISLDAVPVPGAVSSIS